MHPNFSWSLQNAWRRIQQEIRLMEKLDHPLVIRIFETVESPRRIHIVMEHLSGGDSKTRRPPYSSPKIIDHLAHLFPPMPPSHRELV
mmetsp:Transcript_71773/g.203110  ORF Transcript_71773/g.203110 Transcript_71773/m.203110 type:complete len:88 (-) Transcript_71773:862-1125(-)